MRVLVMMAILFAAGACYAEDPLESLNTVEDTLSVMAQYRMSHATEAGGDSRVGAADEERSYRGEGKGSDDPALPEREGEARPAEADSR